MHDSMEGYSPLPPKFLEFAKCDSEMLRCGLCGDHDSGGWSVHGYYLSVPSFLDILMTHNSGNNCKYCACSPACPAWELCLLLSCLQRFAILVSITAGGEQVAPLFYEPRWMNRR